LTPGVTTIVTTIRLREGRSLNWKCTEKSSGRFRCSVFEFRPYPGTPEWHRLMVNGRYSKKQLLDYQHVDVTQGGINTKLSTLARHHRQTDLRLCVRWFGGRTTGKNLMRLSCCTKVHLYLFALYSATHHLWSVHNSTVHSPIHVVYNRQHLGP